MLSLTNVDKFDNLTRIEYQGQLVLTTAQLAEFYECEEHQIRQNFRNNADRFIEKKHMFTLRGLELKHFKREFTKNYPVGTVVETFDYHPGGTVVENFYSQILSSSVLRLWTKRGAARHAKMLNTDRAWDVFERLEDAYFNQVTRPKGAIFVAEYQRAESLRKLASHTRDPIKRERLIDEAEKILVNQ